MFTTAEDWYARMKAAGCASREGLPRANATHLQDDTRVWLQQLFLRLERKGITYSVGTGSETKRGLVTTAVCFGVQF